ncbi:MAG: helix-turn-helix transcriptional regulator, partial [Stomatobaculum sp.]|nr:helix-turn-helix transcriptional regulator [Stomatobaculum sp.]
MAKKVGELIKEARTAAKLTQAQLAEQVTGVTAADIGKAERGEKELTQAALKQIAKATGVTQASLLNAAAGKAAASAGKTASTGKTAAAGKTAAKKPAAGKTASTAKKPAAAKSSMQLTAAEKKLVELYRKADADTKKEVMKL